MAPLSARLPLGDLLVQAGAGYYLVAMSKDTPLLLAITVHELPQQSKIIGSTHLPAVPNPDPGRRAVPGVEPGQAWARGLEARLQRYGGKR